MVLGGSGRMPEAEKAFREAVARDGRDPQYAYNRGPRAPTPGRPSAAAEMFRKAMQLEPRCQAGARLAELPK